jgi:prolipoprotein diacylglyceryltransferase
MQQVLFRIPFPGFPEGIPLYGFGLMLFLAFVICTWLASRRAVKEGIRKESIQDLAIWIFFGGIVGARLTSVISEGVPLWQFFRIWDGGMILYGSVWGGLLGYAIAYFLIIRKQGLSSWKLADVLAPSIAVGIALGRIGCLLNGCCFGHVACADHCPQIHFPLSSPPRFMLVDKGYQTPAGFIMSDSAENRLTVGAVDPGSPAAASGLQAGDMLVKLRDFPSSGQERDLKSYGDLENSLGREWPRGKNSLALTVKRGNQDIDLAAFSPKTLGLHPTQLYESISMVVLFFLLTAYYPFRRRPGEVMALLMLCYGVHRFLNEMLRGDPRPVWEIEIPVSILLLVVGPGLWIWFRWLSAPPKTAAMAAARAVTH